MKLFSLLPIVNLGLILLLAFMVLRRNPRSRVNRAFGASMLSLAIIESGHLLAVLSTTPKEAVFGFSVALAGVCFFPFTWSLFNFQLFQQQPVEVLKRRLSYLIFLAAAGIVFLVLLATHQLVTLSLESQAPWLGAMRFSTLGRWFLVYVLLSTVIMLIVLENIYRNVRHRGGQHALYGLMGGLFYMVFLTSQGLLFSQIPSAALHLGSVVITVAGLFVTYDIVRYRFLQVDIYVGREAVYSSAILLIVGGYLVLMGLVAKLVKVLGGNLTFFFTILAAFLMLFVLLSLLLSGSLKRRLKSFIDRNFYRGRYDYREQWLSFSEEMSSLLDLEIIVPRFLHMAIETLDAEGGCIFMPRESDGGFETAESVNVNAQGIHIPKESQFLDWLFVLSQPIDVNDARFQLKTVPEILQQRDRLQDVGLVVLVPLITKRKLVGLLALKARRAGEAYSSVDLELLEAIGNHFSMAILNAKLSEELVITKEMEFIHKISSFVVHDLKNAISTLSMLLENAANNMENPEFRSNMLQTISGTVERMKNLMGKMRTVPKDMELKRELQDLNQIVKEVMAKTKIDSMKNIRYVEDLHALPLISVDREYIERMLTNIVVNALEAMPEKGTLTVSTRLAGDGSGDTSSGKVVGTNRYVEIAVADTGIGMSPEFVKGQLFRPFQTTKTKGLGIGLYQCREAVEAHGGQIEVKSSQGEGTVFSIRLPINHSSQGNSSSHQEERR